MKEETIVHQGHMHVVIYNDTKYISLVDLIVVLSDYPQEFFEKKTLMKSFKEMLDAKQ